MTNVTEHELIKVGSLYYLGAYDGFCSCSSPDYEDGWYGEVGIYGVSEQDVYNWHHDHVLEEVGE